MSEMTMDLSTCPCVFCQQLRRDKERLDLARWLPITEPVYPPSSSQPFFGTDRSAMPWRLDPRNPGPPRSRLRRWLARGWLHRLAERYVRWLT